MSYDAEPTASENGPELQRVALGQLLKDSLARLNGSKRELLLASAVIVLVSFLATLLASLFFPGIASLAPSQLDVLAAGLVSLLATSPFAGGLILMALTRARGEVIEPGTLSRGFRFATRFLSYGLLTGLLSYVFNLYPGIISQLLFLAVAALISFTPHFMVDRGLQLQQALLQSARLVLLNPLALAGWLLLALLLIVLSAATLGIGLIWALPFIAISSAMFYLHGTRAAAVH